jgi:hypothetical protein
MIVYFFIIIYLSLNYFVFEFNFKLCFVHLQSIYLFEVIFIITHFISAIFYKYFIPKFLHEELIYV